MSTEVHHEPLMRRFFIKIMPLVYSFVLYFYIFVLVKSMRVLSDQDHLLVFGFIPYAVLIYNRALGDYQRMRGPLVEHKLFHWCVRYNAWLSAGILFLFFCKSQEHTLKLEMWNMVFVLLFLRYVEYLFRRTKRDNRTWIRLPYFNRPTLIVPIIFYYNVFYLYALLQERYESFRDPIFQAIFIVSLVVNLLSQTPVLAGWGGTGGSAAVIHRSLSGLSLVVKYLFLTIFLVYSTGKYVYINQIVAVFLYFLPINYFEKKAARFVKDYCNRNYPDWLYIKLPLDFGRNLLFIFFFLYCGLFINPPTGIAWVQSHINYALKAMSLFVFARMEVTLLLLVVFMVAYYLLWIRKLRCRLFFSVAAPIVFMLICYVNFYWDLTGGQSMDSVKTGGAVQVLKYPPPPDDLSFMEKINYSTRFPRALRVDPEREKLFVSFGSIYGNSRGSPSLVSASLDGSNIKQLLLPRKYKAMIRDFQLEPGGDDIFFSAWGYDYLLNRYDRDEDRIIRKYDFSSLEEQFGEYDPYDIVPQVERGRVFLVTGQPPAVIRFNLYSEGTKSFIDVLDLYREGITEYGSILHKAVYDEERNVIYTVAVTGDQDGLLLEVDADSLRVLRKKNFKQIVISVKYDPVREEILMGCGLRNNIIGVDRETFEITKVYKTPVTTIRNFIVDTDRDRVYIVDHLGGTVIEMDRGFEKVIRTTNVGDKPIGMDRFGDSLYIASVLGVFRVDIGGSADNREERRMRKHP